MMSIADLDLCGKRVFIRADLNVPFDKNGQIADDNRITASLDTISLALEKGAKVILASHLGRPDGKRVESFSLAPVGKRIAELLSRKVTLAPDCIGPETQALADNLQAGEILLLENLRFHAEEEENDPAFSQQLANLCDVYVDDAFATAHRAHASTEGMAHLVSVKGAGLTVQREMDYFNKAFVNPKRPLVALLGGAKITTKIKVIRNLAKKADVILIGGAMANTFIAAQGYEVGRSLYEAEQVETAKSLINDLRGSSCSLIIPDDVLVASEFTATADKRVCLSNQIPAGFLAVDIGEQTIAQFRSEILKAGTVIWNGPMGAFEIEGFDKGTMAMVNALADSSALTVVGGGDTDLAIHKSGRISSIDYVSTAGGAFLKLMEGAKLPAIQALES